MNSDHTTSESMPSDPLPTDQFDSTANARSNMNDFADAIELLAELSHAGLDDFNHELQDVIDLLGRLADSVESSISDFNDDDPDVLNTVDFVVESCAAVRQAAFDGAETEPDSGYLDLLREEIDLRLSTQDTPPVFDSSPAGDPDVVAPSQEEIAAMLSGLSSPAATPSTPQSESPAIECDESIDTPTGEPASRTTSEIRFVGDTEIPFPAMDSVELDDELREAFMDDTTRGLESMEQALLDLESQPNDDGPVQTIGRELHTIKGASASIGMSHLAEYIHEVEELIRKTKDSGNTITAELLLVHVDLIRARVDGEEGSSASLNAGNAISETPAVSPPTAANSNAPSATASQPAAPVGKPAAKSALSDSHGDDETVRVKSSQLNRLMDMLSELVMLRNQRDTEISELKGIHDELVHAVTRVRMLSHEGESLLANENLTDPILAEDGVSFSHLNEVANDVLESAQRLRECYQPVADGNQAVSQFIRNFRLELVQLRRTPVSGLFRRLHRAISDAARTEQKQVRVALIGEDTGIERSLQERIFEPLMHIVRNSVSHGIESAADRVSSGKTEHGTITLHAHSGPDLLVIEVRDDGGGLDYDAIRRRGIERGLIDNDKSTSRGELARLIFHPGFSTRESANQISGRGVGMDVVASTLERMRGWVEVDSESGKGSTIRLSLPLPSMIQHAMVFRSGGQLFGLPAQAVRRTGEYDPQLSPIDLNRVLSLTNGDSDKDPSHRSLIELATGAASLDSNNGGDFALLVDRVLGPEEVVVRPMPTMLKSHPLCTGATLSGMGEVVLLLDPRELAEAAVGPDRVVQSISKVPRVSTKEQPKVLVVDDSKSARLRVARALEKYPVTVVQVDDGQAAIELLAKEKFATVFSDIDMPRVSGLELLQTIKSEPRLESIPVIMISSRSVESAGKQASEIGALHYVQKPLTPERFDEVVSTLPWAKTNSSSFQL